MGNLRVASETLVYAVEQTIGALTLADEDEALARLAGLYASQIDQDAEALDSLGPKLLAALEALGASPRARAAIRKGPAAAGSRLEQLRAARRA